MAAKKLIEWNYRPIGGNSSPIVAPVLLSVPHHIDHPFRKQQAVSSNLTVGSNFISKFGASRFNQGEPTPDLTP
jgi:hypothetical protein